MSTGFVTLLKTLRLKLFLSFEFSYQFGERTGLSIMFVNKFVLAIKVPKNVSLF